MFNISFSFHSPTFDEWARILKTKKADFLDTQLEMIDVLEGTQEDVYGQFDENQNSWKPNAPYTKKKKTRLKKDLRVMHERKRKGSRLRDAYRNSGVVFRDGTMKYAYPEGKPYARLLNDGGTASDSRAQRQTLKDLQFLDDEYLRKING